MRIAVVATHPIQYQAPWFRRMAAQGLPLRVFYLWDPSDDGSFDAGFQRRVEWDVDLRSGYAHEFVRNHARRPGTQRFDGLVNPGLLPALRRYDPTAVVCLGYAYATPLALAALPRAIRPPMILRGDSHRLGAPAKRGVRESAIAAIFRRFDAFLYVGAANRRYFSQHGARDEQLFFAPHAVDADRFASATVEDANAFRRAHDIDAAKPMILFAGKLDPVKRPQDLLAAFLSLPEGSATLAYVGTGPLEGELRALAGSRRDVRFVGFCNQAEMPRAYAASDVVVLPSVRETWGLCVNEAMHAGKPAVVSANVGCAEDLVLPDRTGLVFPPGDVDALRARLATCVADRARLRQWGTQAATHVARYSFDRATAGLVEAVEHVAKERR